MSKNSVLANKAYNLRVAVVEATAAAGSGHPSSCLSAADIMAALFFHVLKFDIHDPKNSNNDRFVLSKGHAAPLLYAVYHELGVVSRDQLMNMRDDASVLEGHPTPRFEWADVATGSLGIGLSVGVGMALHARRCKKDFYTYVLLGDSELAEGSVWEAAALAVFYKLNNLVAIVDVNRLGQRGPTMDEYNLEVIAQKFIAFGWQTHQVDGHDLDQLVTVFDHVRVQPAAGPVVILAKTVKGYGVSRIENKNGFHGKAFTQEELPEILAELKKRFYQPSLKPEESAPVLVKQKKEISVQPITFSPTVIYNNGENILLRKAFGDVLCRAGKTLENLVCLDAEVSNSTYTNKFAEKFPERFIECFIAEQAMVGIAQGLAALGDCALISTFSAFLTRAHDQLRMAAISRLPLRVVGTHAGTEVGQDGPSQMGLEDIALFRSLPRSIVLSPCDAVACEQLVKHALNYTDGISYVRLTRGALPIIYDGSAKFDLGDFNVLRSSGHDQVIICATGATVHEALRAHDMLKEQGINSAVVDIYSIKPLYERKLREFVTKTALNVISVEDHYAQGGIGDVMSAALIGLPIAFKKLAVYDVPRSGTCAQEFSRAGIDANAIVRAVLNN